MAGFGFTTTANAARLEVAGASNPDELSDDELDSRIDEVSAIPGADARRWQVSLLTERYQRSVRSDIRRQFPGLSDERVEQNSTIDKLYTSVQRFRRREQAQQLKATLDNPAVANDLVSAYANLKTAVAECPVLPDTYNLLGQLAGILEPESSVAAFQRAIVVEPMHGKTVGLAGCNLMEVRSEEPTALLALRHSMNTPLWRDRREIIQELNSRYGLRYLVTDICPRSDSGTLGFAQSLKGEGHVSLSQRVISERIATNDTPKTLQGRLGTS